MELNKPIIDEIVSYIDFADIRAFVQNHPELVAEEEFLGSLILDNLIIKTKITNSNKIDFMIWKGAKQND